MNFGRFKKRIALSLMTILLGASFVGCSGGNKAEDTTSTTSDVEVSDTDTSEDAEPSQLSVELFDRGNAEGDPVDDNMWTQWIQESMLERDNIDVDYVVVPRGKEVDQLNVLMAADNAPDIIFTYSDDLVYSYARDGGLLELGDLIEEHGPNIKELLGDVLRYGQFEGEQFAIPARRALQSAQVTYMRKDWLDAVGMEEPTNNEEFYDVLTAFKEQDPGNIGDTLVPFKMHIYGYQLLADSYLTDTSEEIDFVFEGTRLEKPGQVDGYKFINKLVNEGLTNLDYVLDKDDSQFEEEFVNGKLGSWTVNHAQSFDMIPELEANVPGAEIVAVHPYLNPQGELPKMGSDDSGILIMIPKASEDKAIEAIKYIDFLCEEETVFFLQNGEEDVHYTMGEDGIPVAISEAVEKDILSGENQDMLITVNGKWLGDIDSNLKASASRFPGYEDLYIDSYHMSIDHTKPSIVYPRPVESKARYGTALEHKWDEFSVRLFSAKSEEFDDVAEQARKELLKAGQEEMIEEQRDMWNEVK